MKSEQPVQVIPGFKFYKTHHCITGSILHVFRFHDCPISEEMLLGLGSGVGFVYWYQKGSLPFLGGRANVGRGGEDSLEVTAARRCSVGAKKYVTSSHLKAEKILLEHLNSGEPLVIQVDMGYLPYFGMVGQFHFGYHMVVAAGFDSGSNKVTLSDRDGIPHLVALSTVSDARSSTFQPFPPHNTWLEYDFSAFHQPKKEDILLSIQECARGMLQPPIKNLGVQGILTAGQRILTWPDKMDDHEIAAACGNIAMYIRAEAGTGGGLFRWMYARFLEEAAALTKIPAMRTLSADMHTSGSQWEQLADIICRINTRQDLVKHSQEISGIFKELAARERSVWSGLREISK